MVAFPTRRCLFSLAFAASCSLGLLSPTVSAETLHAGLGDASRAEVAENASVPATNDHTEEHAETIEKSQLLLRSRLMRRSPSKHDGADEDSAKVVPEALRATRENSSSLVELDAAAAASSGTGIYRPGVRLVAGRVPWLKTRKCLTSDGGLIFVEDCYKGHVHRVPERQKWQWVEKQLKNNEFELCLTQPWHDAKTHGNVELTLEPCGGKATQKWMFDSFGRLKNEFEGYRCLDLVQGNTMMYMNTCNGGESQWFSYY